MDNPNTNVQELHDRINIQLEEFKERFSSALQENNVSLELSTHLHSSFGSLQYDIKYEFHNFISNQNNNTMRDKKRECLVKLLTLALSIPDHIDNV